MIDVSKLEKYTWWQLKKHSAAKKPVFTCSIQDLSDKSVYYIATEPAPQDAINNAVASAEA